MRMYLRKDAETTNGGLATTYCSVKTTTHKTEGVEDEVFADNFFLCLHFFMTLETSKISATMTIQPNQNYVPHDFSTEKKLKLKRGDIKVEATAVLNATVWRDR